MEFAEWFGISECLDILMEVAIKTGIADVKGRLKSRVDMLAKTGKIGWPEIAQVIRHEFLDYDPQADKIAYLNRPTTICAYIKKWNKLIEETHEAVAGFVQTYFATDKHQPLIDASSRWRQHHLKAIPRHCQEEEDPLAYRAARSGLTQFRR